MTRQNSNTERLTAPPRAHSTIFQADNGLEATGEPNEATWKALFDATIHNRRTHTHTFVTVSETIPETLKVHRGSHVVLTTPVNTGVPGAESAQGTFAIFSRFTSTTMTGTNPDGSKHLRPRRALGQRLQRRRRRPRLPARVLRHSAVEWLCRAADSKRRRRSTGCFSLGDIVVVSS